MTTRKERESAARESLIIQRSKELFLERGFDSVTVQDICKAVEYGRSVFYSHFQSKEEVFHHIKLEGIHLLAQLFEAVDPEAKERGAELHKCADILFGFYRDQRLYYQAMFLLPVPEIPAKLGERIKEAEQLAAARPRNLLQRGMEAGEFRGESVDDLVFVYWTSLAGIINFHIQHGDEADKERIRRFCRLQSELFVAGIRAPTPKTV